jgi:hypothetical protein
LNLKSGSRAKKRIKTAEIKYKYTGQDGHGVDIEKKKAREYKGQRFTTKARMPSNLNKY